MLGHKMVGVGGEVMRREAVSGQTWRLSQAIGACSALSQKQVSEECHVLRTGQRLAASWEQDVGAAVQVCKKKGKKKVRPKIATRAVRLLGSM